MRVSFGLAFLTFFLGLTLTILYFLQGNKETQMGISLFFTLTGVIWIAVALSSHGLDEIIFKDPLRPIKNIFGIK
jgi:hypothetical protein